MGEHAKLSASGMYRWSICPGSIRMSKGVVQAQSIYAEEGTIAHEHAAKVIEQDGFVPAELDSELREALLVYRDAIFSDIADYEELMESEDYGIQVEKKLDLSTIYPGCFGTADCIVYFPLSQGLHVYDFKYGAGISVDVKDNPQLKYYALGALIASQSPASYVEMVIVQPRCYHPDGPVRRHRVDALEILDFAGELEDAAKRTEDANAPLVPGDHCRWCPAAGFCPELKHIVDTTAVIVSDTSQVATMYHPEELSRILARIPMMESWIKSVREFAYQEALNGRPPPGWKLVAKRTHRRFLPHVTPEFLMGPEWGLNEELVFDRKMKSPAQIEKCIHPKSKEKFNTLMRQDNTGMSLVPECDNRESLKPAAKDDFDVLPLEG